MKITKIILTFLLISLTVCTNNKSQSFLSRKDGEQAPKAAETPAADNTPDAEEAKNQNEFFTAFKAKIEELANSETSEKVKEKVKSFSSYISEKAKSLKNKVTDLFSKKSSTEATKKRRELR